MSKAEVIQVLGQPQSTRASGGVEYLIYSLSEGVSKPGTTLFPVSIEGQYFVQLVGGRVESYGRVGDFDSTKDPTLNLNIKNK
jgi:hypothetical protein